MHIVIDGRTVADHFPGIGRYVFQLVKALAAEQTRHRLTLLYAPRQQNTRFELAELARHTGITLVSLAVLPFSAGEHVIVPQVLRTLGADLYHAPYFVRPYFGLPCPSVTTLYDAIPALFPDMVSWRARRLFLVLQRLAIYSSRRIITISHSARADLHTLFGSRMAEACVVPLAADARFAPQDAHVLARIRQQYALPERYLLSLASDKPHKNLETLLFAWSLLAGNQPDTQLVLAGHWDTRQASMQTFVQQLGLQDRVRLVPDVAEQDMAGLYGGATLFVFPSLYEGFGLPPLEAMACGVAVLVGRHSSMPEVVGQAGMYADMRDATALAGSITQALRDPARLGWYAERGLQQAADFSWQRTARATLAVYEQALPARLVSSLSV